METFSPLLALCEGNPPVTGGFPSQRPVTRNFDGFFYLRLNKRLSKQLKHWWFEMPSHSLWRHCDEQPKVDHHCICICPGSQQGKAITRHSYGPHLNIKTIFPGLGISMINKTVVKFSDLYHENPHIGKTSSLYQWLVQERCKLAMELCLSCINSSILRCPRPDNNLEMSSCQFLMVQMISTLRRI